MPLGDYERGDIELNSLLAYLPLLYLLPRLFYQAFRKEEDPFVANIAARPMLLMTAVLMGYSMFLTLTCPYPYNQPQVGKKKVRLSDSAAGGMAGARSLLNGVLPYGNLSHHRDTYGPTYYYTYLPFEAAYDRGNEHVKRGPGLPARQLTILLQLLAVLACYLLGRRLQGHLFGCSLALGWVLLPYSLYSAYWSQTGHLMPGVFMLLTFLALTWSPVIGAIAFAWTAAACFFPVFFLPVWWAYLKGNKRWLFLFISITLGLALWAPMLMQQAGLNKFLDSTILFNQSQNMGRWSPWYHHSGTRYIRAYFQLLFPLFAMAAFWIVRGKGYLTALSMTGVVVVGTQLFALHAPGRYHLWMLPILLPLFLLGSNRARFEEEAGTGATAEGASLSGRGGQH